MAIWYETGNGMVKTKMARCSIDTEAFLCCPGPSLKEVKQDIRGPNRLVVAVTTAYPTIKPDMWVGMDLPECYDRNLFYESFPKFMRGGYQSKDYDGMPVKSYYNTLFMDCEKAGVEEMFNRRAHDIKFCWANHTPGMALHLLVWMGVKKIHLLGCDMGGDKDYCHDLELSKENRKSNRRLYKQQVGYFSKFAELGSQHGVEVISNTEGSPLNEHIDYEPLEESLEATKPLTVRPLVHSVSAYISRKVSKGLLPTSKWAEDPDMLSVVCALKSGGCYDAEYVSRLQKGVKEYLNVEHEFTCITDEKIDCDIPQIRMEHDWPGYWCKMNLFRVFTGKTLYLDLDVVINDCMDPVSNLKSMVVADDFYFPGNLNSSVMYWNGDYTYLYERFNESPQKYIDYYRRSSRDKASDMPKGQQGFVQDHLLEKVETWQQLLPGFIASYKADSVEKCKAASIVCYHGKPRPHETDWAISRGDA